MPRERIYRMRNCFITLSSFLCTICCFTFISCTKSTNETIGNTLTEISSLNQNELAGYIENLDQNDPIAPYYRDQDTKNATLEFFSSLAHSENVARVILDNSIKFDVRPSLAFALALEESDFRIDAMNKNGDSVDRGLFQLNSRSYPGLTIKDFYDPATNARYGISHLSGCLAEAGNEVAALAMYNAGNGRVTRDATPKKTLNYVSRILAYEDNIASLFAAKIIAPRHSASSRTPGVARLFAESLSMGLVGNSPAKKN
jgi:soluble lytic murein transglycosylase-like protein